MISMPENVKYIISQLEKSGYEAYAVGGCIRDSLMGLTPHDWDVTTSALPQQVLSSLDAHNIIDSGMKHGTVTVKLGQDLYEITTFRADGEYTDCRRPDSVSFVTSLTEDLARRDFTMNAIAYNDKAGVCDPFSGEQDLKNRLIRCVGDPDKRFGEDALRILRALRFASRLGFEIEEKTSLSLHKNAYLLDNISAERKCSELLQIIDGEYAEKVLIDYSDVLSVVIPEISPMIGFEQHNPHHIYDVWQHTVKVIVNSPHGKVSRLSAMFHDIGKPHCFSLDEDGVGHFKPHPGISADMSREIMNRLRLDKKTITEVSNLILYHDTRPPATDKNIRRMIHNVGAENFIALLELKKADTLAQNPETIDYKLEYIEQLRKIFAEQTKNGEQFSLKTLNINGSDLISICITDGKTIGKTLNTLLSLVIDGELENDHDLLLNAAKNI